MRFFSLLTNVVTHLQFIAAFNVLAVQWPDGLRELVTGLAPINLDLGWFEALFPTLPPLPVRLRNLIVFAVLPFVCLIVVGGMLAMLAAPQLLLFLTALFAGIAAIVLADSAVEIVIIVLLLIMALLSNPVFLCKFNDPEAALPNQKMPKVMRFAQDLFPVCFFIGGIFVAYLGRDEQGSVAIGAVFCSFGFVASISVALQHFTASGRIDRYSRVCRLGTFLSRQTMGVVFFSFNAAVIPVLTLGLESLTYVDYSCPAGTVFNPYVIRSEEQQYSTSPELFCDPCDFTFPASCAASVVAAGLPSDSNLSTALCPAFTEKRLALDPKTPETTSSWYLGLLLGYMAYGFVLLGLFLCTMRRGINQAAEAFGHGEALARVNIDEALNQRSGDKEEDGKDEKNKAADGDVFLGVGGPPDENHGYPGAATIVDEATAAPAMEPVLESTSQDPARLFGSDGGETAAKRWEFVCDAVEAKVFEFCADFRYPARYTYVLLLLHKVAVVAASVPIAPTSSSGAAAGMTIVHGLVFIFLLIVRPFRSNLLARLTLAEVLCEFIVGVFAGISSNEDSDVPAGLGYTVLVINILLPIVAIASTANDIKGTIDAMKERARRRKAHEASEEQEDPLLGSAAGGGERGGEMMPIVNAPPPPPPGGTYYPQSVPGGYPMPQYPPPPHHQHQPGYPPGTAPVLMAPGGVAPYVAAAHQPPMMPPAAAAALRREKAREAALNVPEAKVADEIDSRSKWIVTVPAIVLLIPLVVIPAYMLITAAQNDDEDGLLAIPLLSSKATWLQSIPTTEDPLIDILSKEHRYTNWSGFVADACCLPGTRTSLSTFPVDELPVQERWLWLDRIYSDPPRVRVINHARVDNRQHDPLGSNGVIGVSGLGVRPLCSPDFDQWCELESVGSSGMINPFARCEDAFDRTRRWPQYALQYLW